MIIYLIIVETFYDGKYSHERTLAYCSMMQRDAEYAALVGEESIRNGECRLLKDECMLSTSLKTLKANFEPNEKFYDCDYDCKHLADKLLEIKNRPCTNSWKTSEEQLKAL